jgi:diguanylate cyclase (GGDEF)-like protein/PAS domain S-box-containing protein
LLAVALLIGAAGLVSLWYSRRKSHGLPPDDAVQAANNQLKLMLWASGEVFWDYDPKHRRLRYVQANEESARSAHMALHEREGQMPKIHPQDMPQVMQTLHSHMQHESSPFMLIIRMDLFNNGTWAWIRVRGRVTEHDSNGQPLRIAGTARDITAGHNAEHEQRIASEVMRNMNEAVVVMDRDCNVISVNPAFSRITGRSEDEVIGSPLQMLNGCEQGGHENLQQTLERDGRWSGEIRETRDDGRQTLYQVEITIISGANGRRRLYVMVCEDITEHKRIRQELRHLVNYDPLTGLPNHTHLLERLSRAIVRARQENGRIAVLLVDLDRFKNINDSLGRAAGDHLLHAVAVRLQQLVGDKDTVARVTGDEFVVVMEAIRSPQEAEQMAQRIIDTIGQPLSFGNQMEVKVSSSVGISLYPDHAQVPTELLKHADSAMYQAKDIGRHAYQIYSAPINEDIRHRATLANALRHAMERNELSLVFQPQLSTARQRIVGAEALMRWHSREFGDISPAQFIQLAEDSGLIFELGAWAMRHACTALRRWHDAGMSTLTMAVNVSAQQLRRGDLPDRVEKILAETGLNPRFLELELTESMVMANPEQSIDTLCACRDLGVSLAIDDFGTGYSSLAYLKRLPVSKLKIDREFVIGLTRNDDDDAIAKTIIAMGHSLSKTVVAEGVENSAQAGFLRDHHCDQIQGHYVCRALPAEQCLQFIQDYYPESAAAAV